MLVPYLGDLAFGGSCICSGFVLDGSECIPGTVQLAFELWRAEVVEVQQHGEDHLQVSPQIMKRKLAMALSKMFDD